MSLAKFTLYAPVRGSLMSTLYLGWEFLRDLTESTLIQPHITRRKSFNSCRAHSKKFAKKIALYSYVCWISEKGRYLNKEKGAIIHVVNTRDTLFGAKLSNSKVLQAGNSQFNSSCLPGFEKGLFLRSKNLISSKWLETNQPILVKKLLLIASIA